MPLGTAGGAAIRRNYGTTQPTIAALRAVTLAERFNNQLVYVSGTDSTYEFEPASVAVDDGDLFLLPDDSPATGRWEKRGTGIVAPAAHATSHTDGSDDIQDATAAQKGVATAAQITKLDAIEALADVTGTNPPQAHSTSHTDGSDDIQDATAGQKGVATAAQITKLDGVATGADVTGANAPQDHAAGHVTGGGDVIADAIAAGNSGLMSGTDKTKLDGVAALADVTGSNAPQAHSVSHTDGSDDIQDATAGQKGVATAAQITKLDGIEALAVAAGATGDAHAPLTNNPHAVTAAQAGAADAAHVGAGGAAHADAVAAGADGFMTGTDKTKLDGIAALADVTGSNAPQNHATSHTDGSDDIQDATAGQKGVATAAQITKLDGIAALADVTGSNAPQAHAASHVTGGGDVIADAIAAGNSGLMSGTDKTKLDGVEALADVTGSNAPQAHSLGGAEHNADTLANLDGKVSDAELMAEVLNSVTTTDATLTTIATIAIPDDTVMLFEARIVARRTDSAGRAIYIRNVAVFREAAGSAALQGAVDAPFTEENAGDSAFDATFAVSGNNLLIQVTGEAAKTVNWRSYHRSRQVS